MGCTSSQPDDEPQLPPRGQCQCPNESQRNNTCPCEQKDDTCSCNGRDNNSIH